MPYDITCHYIAPRIGDVSLVTALWRDRETGDVGHVAVPVFPECGLWWRWAREAPAEVRDVIMQGYLAGEHKA